MAVRAVGKQKAWNQGIAFYGPAALSVTERQGAAKAPKRRLNVPQGDHEGSQGSPAEAVPRPTQQLAVPENEFHEAVQDRVERLLTLLRSANVALPRDLPQQGEVVSEDNALLFVARHRRMAHHRGPEVASPRVAFHWTAETNFESIAESNLRVPDGAGVKKKHGAAFGRGIYTSPDFHFAREDFSYGASATFMCLVLTGRQEHRQPRARGNLQDISPDCDSIKGRLPGRPCDTWVFPESDQVLPCFLVDELALAEAAPVLRKAVQLLNEDWPSAAAAALEGAGTDILESCAEDGGAGQGEAAESSPVTGHGNHLHLPADSDAPTPEKCLRQLQEERAKDGGDQARGGRWRNQRLRAPGHNPVPIQSAASETTPSSCSQPQSERRWKGGPRLATVPSESHVLTVAGDLLDAKETFIVHQCCCVLNGPAAGLAAEVFQGHPAADVYRQRRERGRPVDTPGHISIHGKVVNLYGQFCPGKPLDCHQQVFRSSYAECFARFPGISDTPAERLAWFKQALRRAIRALPASSERTLALPARIGCGLAKGNWEEYLKAIAEAAVDMGVLIVIYDKDATLGSLSPATGQVARAAASGALVDAGQAAAGIRKSFWDVAALEFCRQQGEWKRYSHADQVMLHQALRAQQPEVTLGDGCRVVLSGVELGCGQHWEPGQEKTSNSAFSVRLALPRVNEGQISLPEDLDSSPDAVLPSSCGRMLAAKDAARTVSEPVCAVCASHFSEREDEEEEDEEGPIVCLLSCGHAFHERCLARWFLEKPECPTCKHRYGRPAGSQPRSGRMLWAATADAMPGHSGCAALLLRFEFPAGKDEEGLSYDGRRERAFLPDNEQGRLLLALFQLAFRRRVLFGLGVSMTLGVRRPTFNIHLKTSRTGGPVRHGFPDDGYFSRALEELAANGVTLDQLE